MKKIVKKTIMGLMIGSMLTTAAIAADFENCAENLNDLELFRGTAAGYELERAPTRAEAATMLVRLLGKEEEAKKLSYTAPFTDLEGWEKPYVQYLYENGLTTGATTTTFESQKPCTAQMYAAFLLRTLGYTESNGDFSYINATAYATEKGIYHALTVDENRFLRDHVAATSYTALSCEVKNKGISLLQDLVNEEAVSKEKADKFLNLFKNYEAYSLAGQSMRELSAALFEIDTKATVQEIETNKSLFEWKSNASIAIDYQKSLAQMAETAALQSKTQQGKTINTDLYVLEGYLYAVQGGMQNEEPLTKNEQMRLLSAFQAIPIAAIEELSFKGTTANIEVTAVMIAGAELPLETFEAAAGKLAEKEIQTFSITQNIQNGKIASQKTTVAFEDDNISGNFTINAKLKNINDEVQVYLP